MLESNPPMATRRGPPDGGIVFLRSNERQLPENLNRSQLMEMMKEHDIRCMNSRFQKPAHRKATYT